MMKRLSIWALALFFFWGCETEETPPAQDVADAAVDMTRPMPMEDMGVEDMAVVEADMAVPVSTACDEGEVIDFAELGMAQDDGSWLLMSAHNTANDFVGSCGGEGYDAVIRFTAPEAGFWSFLVAGVDEVIDTVLHARRECADVESEIACNDDIVDGRQLESSVQVEMQQGNTIFLVADTYGGSGGAFAFTARLVRRVGIGEACDLSGQTAVCEEGSFCLVDEGEEASGNGTCVENTPPTIERVVANRNGERLLMQVDGADPSRDVTRGLLQLYRGSDRIILDPDQGADTFIIDPTDSVFGLETFVFRYRGVLFDRWPEATGIRVALEDGQGNRSDWTSANLEEAPEAGEESCDEHRIEDACPEGTECFDRDEDGIFQCSPITAPTIDRVKAYFDAERLVMGFEIEGVDPDNDVVNMDLKLLDAEGGTIAEGLLGFETIIYTDAEYWGGLSFSLARDFGQESISVQVIDAEGLRSEAFPVPRWREPQEVAAEDVCDPRRARNTCEAGTICYSLDEVAPPTCGTPDTACPAEWSVTPVSLDANNILRLEGNLNDEANVTQGSCGGGVAQKIYAFTAEQAGSYSFLASSDQGGADTVVYARSHCGIGGNYPDAEHQCSDNHGGFTAFGLVRLTLEEGETAYVFVDGAIRDEGEWGGPYTLVVRRLP